MEMKTRVSYLSPVRLAKEDGFTVTDGGCRAGLTDGGFFNFQDASIVPEADRHALMKYYYGINLDKLIDLEIQYDPTDVFRSGMSIPNRKSSWVLRQGASAFSWV